LKKKLGKLYKIDEITGKSLSKSLVNYDDNEDEFNDEDISDKKSSTNNDENTRIKSEGKSISIESTKSGASKTDTNIATASSLNSQTSPSTPKSNLSPGEIKPISPSSLSEASPISN